MRVRWVFFLELPFVGDGNFHLARVSLTKAVSKFVFVDAEKGHKSENALSVLSGQIMNVFDNNILIGRRSVSPLEVCLLVFWIRKHLNQSAST